MTWYQIVNAKSDSYVADRDAEDLLRAFSAALRDADVCVDAEVFYGRTPSGARLYYFRCRLKRSPSLNVCSRPTTRPYWRSPRSRRDGAHTTEVSHGHCVQRASGHPGGTRTPLRGLRGASRITLRTSRHTIVVYSPAKKGWRMG